MRNMESYRLLLLLRTRFAFFFFQKFCFVTNYLITESEVVTGKSQTEALPY